MIGSSLNHYRIIREPGKGSMGDVYLAEDTRLGGFYERLIELWESADPEFQVRLAVVRRRLGRFSPDPPRSPEHS